MRLRHRSDVAARRASVLRRQCMPAAVASDPEAGLTPDISGGIGTPVPTTGAVRGDDLFMAVDLDRDPGDVGMLILYGASNGIAFYIDDSGNLRFESRGSGGIFGQYVLLGQAPEGNPVTVYAGYDVSEGFAGIWARSAAGVLSLVSSASGLFINGIGGSATGAVGQAAADSYPDLGTGPYNGTLTEARIYFTTPPPASLPAS